MAGSLAVSSVPEVILVAFIPVIPLPPPETVVVVNAPMVALDTEILVELAIKLGSNFGQGHNITTRENINLLENGIIDPTKVTRCALENAASVAGTILITECVVVNKAEEKAPAEQSMF